MNDQYGHLAPVDSKDLTIYAIDIEVSVPTGEGFPEPIKAAWPINAITVTDRNRNQIYSFGLGPWCPIKAVANKELDKEVAGQVRYKHCRSEEELLRSLLTLFKIRSPHIVTGWHSEGFDMIYIHNRLAQILPGSEKRLSPWNKAYVREYQKFGKTSEQVNYKGIAQLDYKELYEKYTFKKRDSYKLNHIAWVELKQEKLSYEEEKSLFTLANNNFQKFMSYNILDAVLIDRLDEKLNLISMVVDVAYIAKINYEDVFSPVKIWDALILNRMLERGEVPHINTVHEPEPFPGGYFKEPIPALSKWIVSWDYKGLYPSLIQQFNIGFDTILDGDFYVDKSEEFAYNLDDINTEELQQQNVSLAANNLKFDLSKQSILAEIHEELMTLRDASKKEDIKFTGLAERELNKDKKYEYDQLKAKWNTRNKALKVIANAGYGVLGSIYFRFFDTNFASAVTLSGQCVIKYIEKCINDYIIAKTGIEEDYCTAIATDSVYFSIDRLMQPLLTGDDQKDVDTADEICNHISENIIKPNLEKFALKLNCRKQLMFMDREVIAKNGFWQAKQNYALDVYDSEGVRYKEPKLKVMGLSMIRSSTPEWCRDKMKDGLKIMLRETDEDRMVKYFDKCEEEFKSLSPEAVSANIRAGDFNKYKLDDEPFYGKGALAWTKGMLLHNRIIENKDLKDIPPIMSGEMCKWAWLQQPNPWHSTAIAYESYLDERLELRDYVCYDKQFEKTFKKALTDICDNIGISYSNSTSLTDFFG
ncbi:MAG: DNA polymerase domain-containing protein [Candidatus Izemoplasma sp.]